jgi:hypothetical protein
MAPTLLSTTQKQRNSTMRVSMKRRLIMRKQRAATNVRLECIQAKLQKPTQTNTERNSAWGLGGGLGGADPSCFLRAAGGLILALGRPQIRFFPEGERRLRSALLIPGLRPLVHSIPALFRAFPVGADATDEHATWRLPDASGGLRQPRRL